MSGEGKVPELDVNALVSASQIAQYAGVHISTVVKWKERGHLPVATDETGQEIRDERGRPLYRLGDAARAENATRQRAEKMARVITRSCAW